MKTSTNTEKALAAKKRYFTRLSINDLNEQIKCSEKSFLDTNLLLELVTEQLIGANKQLRKSNYLQDPDGIFEAKEEITIIEKRIKFWDERLVKERTNLQAAIMVLTEKQLSHEK